MRGDSSRGTNSSTRGLHKACQQMPGMVGVGGVLVGVSW